MIHKSIDSFKRTIFTIPPMFAVLCTNHFCFSSDVNALSYQNCIKYKLMSGVKKKIYSKKTGFGSLQPACEYF